MSLVLVPSAVRLFGVAVTVIPATTVPVKVTVTDCFTLFEVAVTVADPAVVLEVKDTVTTPVSSGVVTLVLESVPRVVEKVTAVPLTTALPAESFSVAVIALELVPLAGMLVGLAVSVMVPTGTELVKVTVVVAVIKPYTAVTVAVPVVVGAIRLVLAMPSLFVATVSVWMLPNVVAKVTDSPTTANPFASLIRTEISETSVPLANMVVGLACISVRVTPTKVTVVESERALTIAVTVDATDVELLMEVSLAEAIPSTVSAVASIVPNVAEKETRVPSAA